MKPGSSSELETLVEYAYSCSSNSSDFNKIHEIIDASDFSENEKKKRLGEYIAQKSRENTEALAYLIIGGTCEID